MIDSDRQQNNVIESALSDSVGVWRHLSPPTYYGKSWSRRSSVSRGPQPATLQTCQPRQIEPLRVENAGRAECAPRAALENAPSGRVFSVFRTILAKNVNFWRFLEIPPPPRIEPVTAPLLRGA